MKGKENLKPVMDQRKKRLAVKPRNRTKRRLADPLAQHEAREMETPGDWVY